MKKIFAFILCLMLLCATPLAAFAEGEAEVPTENEIVTEGEISPPAEDVPPTEDTTPPEEDGDDWENVKDTISETIVKWIEPNIEEIGVVVTLIGYGIVLFKKLRTILKSAGTINNNAITIADNSNAFMSQALSKIEAASGVIVEYDRKINALLEAYHQTAEDKQRLENEIVEMRSFLKTATDANVEFANELAELLTLANIPNHIKEQLGSRHVASINAIIEAEAKAEAASLLPTNTEEVNKDVGEEK